MVLRRLAGRHPGQRVGDRALRRCSLFVRGHYETREERVPGVTVYEGMYDQRGTSPVCVTVCEGTIWKCRRNADMERAESK